MKNFSQLIPWALLALCALSTGCAKYEIIAGKSAALSLPQTGGSPDLPPVPSETVICDPFGTGNSTSVTQGIQGDIRYLSMDQPRYSSVQDFASFGHRVTADVFMSQLNVPTRYFTNGFTTQAGKTIKDETGNQLDEWFSLQLKTTIVLSGQDTPGDYQFAVISDDGMVVTTDPATGTPDVLVNNDGQTPSRLGCGTGSVHFDSSTRLPVKVGYFQGPKYHIALMLLWRKVPAQGSATDPLCGVFGNSEYFDWNQTPSAPLQPYRDLLSRGWKPLAPENYVLTDGTNKCI